MTNLAIAANGLHKSYGDKTVLDDIDLAYGSPEVAAWRY
jgi:ABC-2 type transport system ATP-binding protein